MTYPRSKASLPWKATTPLVECNMLPTPRRWTKHGLHHCMPIDPLPWPHDRVEDHDLDAGEVFSWHASST